MVQANSGGETQKDPSGWTVDTLHALVLSLLNEGDRRYEQRFAAQEQAIAKQERDYDKRFDGVNEFRGQLDDQARTFMPRAESIQRHDSTAEKLSDLETRMNIALSQINSRLDLMTGRSSGLDKGWALLVGALVAVGSVIGVVLAVAS